MADTLLPDLLPLGGAAALLIYLLRLIQYERVRWIKERASLLEEHRADTERRDLEHQAELARRELAFERCEKRCERLRLTLDQLLEGREDRTP